MTWGDNRPVLLTAPHPRLHRVPLIRCPSQWSSGCSATGLSASCRCLQVADAPRNKAGVSLPLWSSLSKPLFLISSSRQSRVLEKCVWLFSAEGGPHTSSCSHLQPAVGILKWAAPWALTRASFSEARKCPQCGPDISPHCAAKPWTLLLRRKTNGSQLCWGAFGTP